MPRFISLNIEYLFYQIYTFFYSITHGGVSVSSGTIPGFSFSPTFVFFSAVVSTLLGALVAYYLIKTHQLHINEDWRLYNLALARRASAARQDNPKWTSIEQFSNSENPSDWKIAVIEADKLLDDTLQKAGAVGEGMGDRLKNFDPKSTAWLNDAWEAHKIRNRIAHEGEFELNKHDTKKALARYESALRALGAI